MAASPDSSLSLGMDLRGCGPSVDSDNLTDSTEAEIAHINRWRRRNVYYYRQLHRLFKLHVPPGSSVLEIGCGLADLLRDLQPSRGVGIESNPREAELAARRFGQLEIVCEDYSRFEFDETFDYVIVSNALARMSDVQAMFERVRAVCRPDTRVVVAYFNALWEPVLKLAALSRQRANVPEANWLGVPDVLNLLDLADLEVVRTSSEILFPKNIPLVSTFLNRCLCRFWPFNKLPLVNLFIARPRRRAAA